MILFVGSYFGKQCNTKKSLGNKRHYYYASFVDFRAEIIFEVFNLLLLMLRLISNKVSQ